jgi:hypothetical protein
VDRGYPSSHQATKSSGRRRIKDAGTARFLT